MPRLHEAGDVAGTVMTVLPIARPGTASGIATATDEVAARLLASYESTQATMQHVGAYELPSMEQVARIVEQCRTLLFPGFVGPSVARLPRTELRDQVRERVDELRNTLRRQVYRGLHHKQQITGGGADLECTDCAVLAE